ncbi:F-box protein 25/32 [Mytilus galloprovincialis]|uniref:F-box protein 25/32 n=1 Tax=Mytilus galloprovincialis TaxID=29158 RepID=A0A8B6HE09_MYTGA|nr:F-box protein 25/32 [Mytilus galloprovincialis]
MHVIFCSANEDIWQPCIHNIQGIGKERRITILSLSETLQKLEVEKVALTISGFRYCSDFFRSLLTVGLNKISGTSQKQVFIAIEKMLFEAFSSDTNLICVRKLLRTALSSLEKGERNRIGSKRLWNKHKETVSNLLCRLDMHEIKPREEDGKPMFLDLPKECVYNIISKLSNPKDILNLGQACSDLNIICKDSLLWQQLCFLHFSEKQVASLITDDLDYSDINWTHMFHVCKRRFKLTFTEVYGDEVVLCDNCRQLYWRIKGHQCFNPDMAPSKSSITPEQFVSMLNL